MLNTTDYTVRRCAICGKETVRPKYCSDECLKIANDRNNAKPRRKRTRSTGEVFMGCDDDCFNCKYSDCLKPYYML